MGWDRVRFFETLNEQGEPSATLISADKQSADVVYGSGFTTFLGCLGYRATQVIDRPEITRAVERAVDAKPLDRQIMKRFALTDVIDFPEAARADWYGQPTATHAIEVQPPITDKDMGSVTRYLDAHCEPSDAGPLYLDHRNGHQACGFGAGQGGASCPPRAS